MQPKEILKESSVPALKQLIDCVLNQEYKNDYDDYYNHLFNIKRLILEIQYENIEKKTLRKFFKDIDSFLGNKIGGTKDCRNVLQLLHQEVKGSKHTSFFGSFFNGTSTINGQEHKAYYEEYTCKGKPIKTVNNLKMGKAVKVTTITHHYLPESSSITKDDIEFLPEDKLKKLFKNCRENLYIGSKHHKAVFLSPAESLKKLKEDNISSEKKLYKLGLPAFQYRVKMFILYFNLKDRTLFTPTTLDAWLDHKSYFLPKPPDDSEGKGHFGLTIFIPDPENKNESGLPEAVVEEFSCSTDSIDIDYLGINKTDEFLEQYKKNFKQFVGNLKIDYKA